MEYYRIRHDIKIKIIGRKYPQVESVIIPTQWDDPQFIESYINKKAPDDVLLPSPILYKSSKLTDLISASTVGLSLSLLISDRLKRIVEKHKFYGIQFFSVKVSHCETEYNYWILHPFDFFFKQLNLEKSVIGYYSDLVSRNRIKKIIPNDYLELENEIKRYDEKMINDLFDGNSLNIAAVDFKVTYSYDFFCLRCITGGVGFFISDTLKIEIENAGCTGIIFTGSNEIYP